MFKKLFTIMAAGSLLVGGAVQAAPVVTAATLSLSIQGLAPINLSGSGTISINFPGSSSTFVPAGLIQLATTIVVPVTAATAINQIKATKISNLSGTFRAGGALADAPGEACPGGLNSACVTGGGVGGAMGLTGTIFVSVIPGLVVIPVNLNAALVGQGGSTVAGFTFDAAPWTTGVGQVTTATSTPTTNGTNSNVDGGSITLVTPTFVLALGNLLPIFARLTLVSGAHTPVPEPGSLLLIGTGIAGLALLGRSRK